MQASSGEALTAEQQPRRGFARSPGQAESAGRVAGAEGALQQAAVPAQGRASGNPGVIQSIEQLDGQGYRGAVTSQEFPEVDPALAGRVPRMPLSFDHCLPVARATSPKPMRRIADGSGTAVTLTLSIAGP